MFAVGHTDIQNKFEYDFPMVHNFWWTNNSKNVISNVILYARFCPKLDKKLIATEISSISI